MTNGAENSSSQTSAQSSLKINNVGEKSHVDKHGTEFFQTTNSNEIFPSKAIARKITLSKSARFYFEQLIDFS